MTNRKARTAPAPATLLADLVAAGPALLADVANYPDLVLVSHPASGPYHKDLRPVDRPWFAKGDGTAWALCYSVDPACPAATKAKVAGCVWGYANSYRTAAADVARKATTLRNVRDDLVPGSVFATPTVIVPPAQVDAAKALLADAHAAWVAAAAAHATPKPRRTRGKRTA